MPIIKDCELWFLQVNPKRPNKTFNPENPTWECQIRTQDKAVKKMWEEMHLPVKAIVPDEGAPYFRVNLRKKTIKSDGEKATPVKIINGELEEIDPDTVGNGSIGNVRIFQYEYSKGGMKSMASVLMGIQVTKHVMYKRKARDDDFQMTETETVGEDNAEMGDDAF
jgi:hypothetical protein